MKDAYREGEIRYIFDRVEDGKAIYRLALPETDNQIALRETEKYIKYHYSRYNHYDPNLVEFRKWLQQEDSDG